MRIVATEYLSLDGVFQEPGEWSGPFFNDEAAQFKWAELKASDALLLGRRTYEEFAAAWPSMPKQTGEFGEKMNDENVYDEIRKLRQLPGQDLLLAGSGQLFNALQRENLIDRYRFMVHPIVLGKGAKLFADGTSERTLKPAETKAFQSGIVIPEYTPS